MIHNKNLLPIITMKIMIFHSSSFIIYLFNNVVEQVEESVSNGSFSIASNKQKHKAFKLNKQKLIKKIEAQKIIQMLTINFAIIEQRPSIFLLYMYHSSDKNLNIVITIFLLPFVSLEVRFHIRWKKKQFLCCWFMIYFNHHFV